MTHHRIAGTITRGLITGSIAATAALAPQLPTEPVDPKPLPDGGEVTVPVTDPGTPDQGGEPGLPRTGNDTTTVTIGLGLIVLGAGLGFTAISMSRRRHPA